MITINLLPQEYRRTERTSIKVFLTMIMALIAVCCSLGYFGHVYLYDYKTVEGERMSREEKLKGLEPQAKYDDALVAEKKEYQRRSQTIQKIANSRVLWTRMLDLFIDVVNNDGNADRHNVWFRNMTVRGGQGRSGPSMTFSAFSQTASFTKQANFIDDVTGNPEFFKDMSSINAPGGRVISTASKFPPQAIAFKLELRMKPPGSWQRNLANRKKK